MRERRTMESLAELNVRKSPGNIAERYSKEASTLLPRVHLIASLLKRWLDGTHQEAVSVTQSFAVLPRRVYFSLQSSRIQAPGQAVLPPGATASDLLISSRNSGDDLETGLAPDSQTSRRN